MIRLGVLGLIGLLGVACGSNRNCDVAGDQAGSFMAVPSQYPLTLTMDQSWSSAEQDAIRRAAGSWNEAARRAGKPDFFIIQTGAIASLGGSTSVQACDLPALNDQGFAVVRISGANAWSDIGFTDSTPAVTLRCHHGDELDKQVVLVNADLITQEQLESVFLHELGHAIGLDHSCQLDRDSNTFRGCAGLSQEHPYSMAVMYPALRIAAPLASPKFWGRGGYPSSWAASGATPAYDPASLEIKEILQSNDLERLSCLMDR